MDLRFRAAKSCFFRTGNYRHFLVNGLNGAPAAGANLTFEPSGGTAITSYASPGPIAGTGPHR